MIKDMPLNGGIVKVAVDPGLFKGDPGNTLGSLAFPYATFATIFEYQTDHTPDVDAWYQVRSTITLGLEGVNATDEATGFTGTQTYSDTSFFKKGAMSTKAYFTVKGHAVSPVGLPYAPDSSTLSTTADDNVVSRQGVALNNVRGISNDLIKAALHGSYWEVSQESRQCYSLLGLSAQNPAGFGIASQDDATNGTLGCGQMAQYARPIVIEPSSQNSDEYEWRMTFGHTLGVERDPSFDAPANNTVAVIKCQAFFDGYFSDENGIPLVMDGDSPDIFEALKANNVKIGY